ncbi:uncharacterized protein [Setaria viridis]|uniref:Protein kinase domain-containing protein n=1 Tax=Setaria viridis TaxID=4556 RepID=A0A4U6TG59_SETVI|nr:uncharacterized protein LOC117834792 isoform X2 [Setaria viridis]TKW01248.1 hypothetical protein SEVIR_8G168000v2 [Setaria viridis]
MAYRRASPFLFLATAHLCFMSPHNTAAVSFSYNFSKASDREKLWYACGDREKQWYASCDPSAAGDGISITKMDRWSTGRVAYKEAVRLWDDRTGKLASFNTSFSFAIGRSGSDGNAGADGMAFFVGPFPPSLPQDSGGAFLGLFPNNKLAQGTVGVEFDTLWNPAPADWEPNDITTDHVGIEVGNIWNIISHTKDLAKGSLSGPMEANIAYDAGCKLMVVTLRLANGSSVSVQATLDLKDVAGLGPDAAVGFSAATGDLFDSHQLLSWSFSSTALASASLAGLVAALLCLVIRRQGPEAIPLPVARKFSYRELSTATKNFSKDRKLGEGSFGEVYRGDLRDPRMPPVAVKRLTKLSEQTRRDYVTEIMILGQLKHRNLVKLVGWCDGGGDDKPLLVYELVTNRSLDDHLHGSSERLLTWPERYKIVIGIGSAIEYLHTGDKDAILHRDIKPSNVMLDDAFEAKLGDFRLVRQVKPGQGSLRGTTMVGSWDYMNPKCITTDSVITASDMYSFGVLLLEIATGKRPRVVPQDDEELSLRNALVDSVWESYGKGAVLEMADARLNGDFDERQMERVMLVGLLCVNQDRGNRLGIREAVNLLSNLRHPLPEPEDDVPLRPLVEVMPPPMEIELPVARKFSYHELTLATDSFSEDRKLGAGSFGAVYRGDLRDRRRVDAPVAVKKFTLLLKQTRRDFVTEIMILGQLKHRNLVKLIGWCDGGGDDKLLLVYELVTNRSLDDHLHGSSERLLTWPERYKIVLGIGFAIEYLHTGDKDAILHRDIKPSNVMLDDAFEAKLGDFGLVRQVKPGQGSLRGTAMVGSWEYMDPKCITTDSATTASDMYSFGVLLLEIATGKRPRVVPQDDEELSLRNALVDSVRESYGKGAVLEMADARLNGDLDERQMERVMLVGLLCVHQDRRNRPGIREAVNLLSNLGHQVCLSQPPDDVPFRPLVEVMPHLGPKPQSHPIITRRLLRRIMRRPRRAHSMIHIELEVARTFSYKELSAATSNFSEDRRLGAGSFGVVYRGELQDPRMPPVVAVKKVMLLPHQTKDFVTEIITVRQLSHRNLVKLLGWCSGGKLLLVYELVTNGSLDDHLHGSEGLLTWPERYKIVLCVGAAIDYLHNGYRNCILHRDIKPSNVMLDDDFNAKLGDFGLARQLMLDDAFDAKLGDFGLVRQVKPGQGSLRGTTMAGSWGYVDPKCITTDSATTASDMYSFGVLLLEIATGERPWVVDEELSPRNALVDAVRESYGKGAVLEMADARLNGDFDERQMERVMLVGLLCVELERQHRPNIKRAVNLLSDLSLPLL